MNTAIDVKIKGVGRLATPEFDTHTARNDRLLGVEAIPSNPLPTGSRR
jgi:hypothetical protein